MPNWTTSYMKFKTQQEAEKVWNGMQIDVQQYSRGEDGMSHPTGKFSKEFSFESVIPTPKTKEECPDYAIIDENQSGIEKMRDRPWFNWYTWKVHNWGTKWDACEADLIEDEIYFQTAWDSPLKEVYQKIADKFEIGFTLSINDEDGGWRGEDYIFTPNAEMQTEEVPWQIAENEMREISWQLEDYPEPDENDCQIAAEAWKQCSESGSLEDFPDMFAKQRETITDEDELIRRFRAFICCCEENEEWEIMKKLVDENDDIIDFEDDDDFDDDDE